MSDAINMSLRRGLLSRRQRIASILEDLEYQELEVTVRTLGHEETKTLDRWRMLGSLDDWYHRELMEVDNALARIDRGRFGICLGCGSAIDPNALKIFPEAEFCRNCEDLKKWMKLG